MRRAPLGLLLALLVATSTAGCGGGDKPTRDALARGTLTGRFGR